MAVFIQKGDRPMTVRQAIKRGETIRRSECPRHIEDYLVALPHKEMPQEALDWLATIGVDSYQAYAASWRDDNAINAENNRFNHALAAYRKALARLDRYRLAEGRPEITEEQETGETDPETGEPITQTVVVQSYIPPFEPANIEQPIYDPETGQQAGTETVTHPQIARDEAERAEAQAVVDATPQAVRKWDAAP